MIFTRALTT
jgi:hypothetical protein